MAKTKSKFTYFDGRKTVDLWGDDLTGWTVTSGEGAQVDSDYFKLIPTLYRAVQLRANAVANMPFEILQGKAIYDSSDDWQNKVDFLPNPTAILQLVESALSLCGKAYLFRDRSAAGTKMLRYHLPDSVKVEINKKNATIEYFERSVDNVPKQFSTKDYVYFWPPDPYVEFGPATHFPAMAAANACGVLMNVDIFAQNFFERGAIKAMLLKVSGMPMESDRQKLEAWWQRIINGVKNVFGAHVINADTVEPVIIGEGMKELENVTIGSEKREDIAVAIGIPMSILFANAANYATSKQDELNFLNKTIIPECEFISEVLNSQVFTPLGLHFNFRPETLDAMQEDEKERAVALGQLVTALADPIAEVAMEILGYEIDDIALAKLQELWNAKKAAAEKLAEQMAQKPEPEKQEDESEDGKPNEQPPQFQADVQKWLRKSLNAFKRGKSPAVTFESMLIPADVYKAITERLSAAKDETSIKAAFAVGDTIRDTTPFVIDWETLREATRVLQGVD